MNNWILAGALIIMIVTAAAAAVMLLLDAMERRKEQPQQFSLWKLELWNIAKGYCVNLQFRGSMVLGRNELFQVSGYQQQVEPDVTVSRQHCMLYEQEGYLLIWNLSAVNPADLNGHRINAPQYLRTGDKIKMGHSVFLVTRIEYV